MKYISIDTETSGLNPDRNNLLEVGLVVAELGVPFQLNENNHLRLIPIHNEIIGDPYALNMNKELISETLNVSQDMEGSWVRKYYRQALETICFKSE